ncbi:hypothetical protein GCM10007981_10270 [Thermocladium modestius]|uniref:Uncharacterized protein n=1 Tax=Thermocladium modestius TaxID=62609 RepID=A0A830GW61_9CREN|nr:hypothetical protein GCM10007981_10270 [Thermocladium modestius]
MNPSYYSVTSCDLNSQGMPINSDKVVDCECGILNPNHDLIKAIKELSNYTPVKIGLCRLDECSNRIKNGTIIKCEKCSRSGSLNPDICLLVSVSRKKPGYIYRFMVECACGSNTGSSKNNILRDYLHVAGSIGFKFILIIPDKLIKKIYNKCNKKQCRVIGCKGTR